MPPPASLEAVGGLFRDMKIHDFDFARFMLREELTEVFALGNALIDPGPGAELNEVDSAIFVPAGQTTDPVATRKVPRTAPTGAITLRPRVRDQDFAAIIPAKRSDTMPNNPPTTSEIATQIAGLASVTGVSAAPDSSP